VVVDGSLSSIAAISSPCALSGEMTANFTMCFLFFANPDS
jgi:hypothetical protein